MDRNENHVALNKGRLISIIAPAYNEGDVLLPFYNRLVSVLDTMTENFEIIFVNDGSIDKTLPLADELRRHDERITIISLSRNFGKEIALTAGLDYAQGDAAIIIDTDLQDPPELIPQLVHYWKEGFDIVYAKRVARDGESIVKKASAYCFYRVMKRLTRIKIPEDTGDFRLLSRQAVDSLSQLREQHRFMKGLFSWIGFSQKEIPYRRDPRYGGKTKWNYWALWNFALDGITSFTAAPLKISTYFGLFVALCAFLFGVFIFIKTFLYGDPVAGYPSLMVVILFLGGVQLMAIGIIGEYIGRLFDEAKGRPLYFIKDYIKANFNNNQNQLDLQTNKKVPFIPKQANLPTPPNESNLDYNISVLSSR